MERFIPIPKTIDWILNDNRLELEEAVLHSSTASRVNRVFRRRKPLMVIPQFGIVIDRTVSDDESTAGGAPNLLEFTVFTASPTSLPRLEKDYGLPSPASHFHRGNYEKPLEPCMLVDFSPRKMQMVSLPMSSTW